MENKFENIEVLIARVLSGEAGEAEQALVRQWRSLSEENEKEFASFERIFSESASLKYVISVDTDKAWERVKSQMSAGKTRIIPIHQRPAIRTAFRIAAMLILAAGIGALVYYLNNRTPAEATLASADFVLVDSLPDGSTVTLNRNSSVRYAAGTFGNERRLRLTGEAFFDVKHKPETFRIEAKGLIIEDIGTAFNVKAYPGERMVVVTVASGEVKIYTDDGPGLNLLAGEEATYDTETKTFTRSDRPDPNISAYRDKIFIFENTELGVIVKLLNDVYRSNIVFGNDTLKACRLTATFNNEAVDTILDVIAETLQLQVNKTATEIKINGSRCR